MASLMKQAQFFFGSFEDKMPTQMEETFERDFSYFFEYCTKEKFSAKQMQAICQPLIWQRRLTMLKQSAIVALLLLLGYLLWQYCDSCSWCVSALGRLLLIELLPYWNWSTYYNEKCLIERTIETPNSKESSINYQQFSDNCLLCENLEKIPTTINVSFSTLESLYLERGLPIIVTDAHMAQNLSELLHAIQHKANDDFLTSEPCDLVTNLSLRKFFNLKAALQKIAAFDDTESWFLQFRNCRFNAVKSSRLFLLRPYYYPGHLAPYYSSWLLLSHNYVRAQKHIYLKGLILMQQLSGQFDLRLTPQPPCNSLCPRVSIHLGAGEGLLFSTDLWRLSFGVNSIKSDATSVATVLELDWQF